MQSKIIEEWQQLRSNNWANQLLNESTKYDEKIAFSIPKNPDFNKTFLLDQLALRNKALKKLPSWVRPDTIFSKIPLEQCTSELLAKWKSSYFRGDSLIDLTGGMGVDVWAMAPSFRTAMVYELNPERAALLKHNLSALGLDSVLVHSGAASAENLPHCSLLYVDPDRRIGADRSFKLEDAAPDVLTLLPYWLKKSDKVVVKASPMLPLSETLSKLTFQPSEIIALGDSTELKEILLVFQPEFHGETQRYTVVTGNFFWDETKEILVNRSSHGKGSFLWDPHPGQHKLGTAAVIANKFSGEAENDEGHYFHFNQFVSLPGSMHEVVWQGKFKEKDLKQWMKENGEKRIQIRCRKFFHTPEQIAQKWKIASGGDFYLWCYHKNGVPWMSVTKYPRIEKSVDSPTVLP